MNGIEYKELDANKLDEHPDNAQEHCEEIEKRLDDEWSGENWE